MMRLNVVVIVVVSVLVISAVNAGPGRPQISVGLNSDLLDKGLLNALEPTIQWETSESFPNGAEIEVRIREYITVVVGGGAS